MAKAVLPWVVALAAALTPSGTPAQSGHDLGADGLRDEALLGPGAPGPHRALLRRAHPPSALPDEVRFGDVVVDFRSYEAKRGGAPVDMTPKEFQLLRLLAARAGQVVSRGELLEDVWGYETLPNTRTVDNHVASLRSKLEPDKSATPHIQTVHGVGYKFVP